MDLLTVYPKIFKNKKVIIFSKPGIFTDTPGVVSLSSYERMYDDFISRGINEIYCISINDKVEQDRWAKYHMIEKVKWFSDPVGEFSYEFDMICDVGWGPYCWRYAMIVDNGKIKNLFVEPGKDQLAGDRTKDPYGETAPENVIKFV